MNKNTLNKSLYLSLSYAFDTPSEPLFRISEKNPLLLCLALYKKFYPGCPLSDYYDKLFVYLQKAFVDLTFMRERYYHFFMSPDAKLKPYESFWIDGEIFGKTTEELLREYRENGFLKSDSFPNLADYLPVELEYIYHIYDNEEVRNLFIEKHLKKWIGRFASAVMNSKAPEFYKVLSLILKTLVVGGEDD